MAVIRNYSEKYPLIPRPMYSTYGRNGSKYSLLVRAYTSCYRTLPQSLKSLAPTRNNDSWKGYSAIAWALWLLVTGCLVISVNPMNISPLNHFCCSKMKRLIKICEVWEAWYKIIHPLSLWLVLQADAWLVVSDGNSIYTRTTSSFQWKQIASTIFCSLEQIKMHLK